MVDTELLEKKELRDKMSGRVDVLNKVKELFLVPNINMVTTQQVADYYEVPFKTIATCYERNKFEISADGAPVKKISELKLLFEVLESSQAKCKLKISDNILMEVPNRGIRMFSQRAVLRIGMLLRDSDVAKEVRTQLLNTFEHSTEKQKTTEIDKELDIIKRGIADASISGTMMELSLAWKGYADYLNRHNTALQEKNEELATNNKALAGEVLKWGDRESLNKAVRVMSGTLNKPISYVWKYLYDELLYHHHIGLSMRGKPPVIQYLHEDEWPKLLQSLAAVCETNGLSFEKVVEKSKLSIQS